MDSIKLNFKEEGLQVVSMNKMNNVMVKSNIERKFFEQYEVLGLLGIADINLFKGFVKVFKQKIELYVKENLLVLKEGPKKVNYILSDVQFITTPNDMPELKVEFKDKIILDVPLISSVLADMRTVGAEQCIIEKKAAEKITTFKIGEKESNSIEETLPTPEVIEDGIVKIPLIDKVLKNIDKIAILQMISNAPIKILEETEMIKSIWVIAPLIENPIEETKAEVKTE